jgi:hypothetical protein
MRISSRSLLLVVAVAAVACAATAPAPASAATNPCRAESMRPGSTILAATKDAVVFRSRKYKTEAACTYRDKRITVIGGFACCQLVRYALSGRYLAYAARTDQADFEVDEMGVVDLRTGKRLRYKKQSASTTVDTNGYVESFFVTSRGTLVWSQTFFQNEAHTDENEAAIRTIAPGGETKDLDDSNTVDATSLGVSSSGKRAYWVNGEAVKSAAL